MAQVKLKINGHAHTVGCKDGEEAHLTAMGGEVEKRIERVKALGMNSGESKVLAMAALTPLPLHATAWLAVVIAVRG